MKALQRIRRAVAKRIDPLNVCQRGEHIFGRWSQGHGELDGFEVHWRRCERCGMYEALRHAPIDPPEGWEPEFVSYDDSQLPYYDR